VTSGYIKSLNKPQNIDETLEKLLLTRIRQLSFPLEPKPTGVSERLVPLNGIRAVLFDVYGTLFVSGSGDISIASEMSNQQALVDALQWVGFSGNLEKAGVKGAEWLLQAIQHTHTIGRNKGIAYPEVDIRDEWETVLALLQREHLIEGELTPEAILRVSVEYEYRVNPVWPMPDLRETLEVLQAKQFVLGIVSNAQFYTLLMFPAFLGQPYTDLGFDPNLCAWSFQLLEAKPSPNLFSSILEHLRRDYGISPQETLYVGNDKLNDIFPAAQLGLKTCLFAGDLRSLRLREQNPRCAHLEPDLIITKLSQFLESI
jgi:putative hydrolase of the HAD superfamily